MVAILDLKGALGKMPMMQGRRPDRPRPSAGDRGLRDAGAIPAAAFTAPSFPAAPPGTP